MLTACQSLIAERLYLLTFDIENADFNFSLFRHLPGNGGAWIEWIVKKIRIFLS
jgi:hypothetical protein